MKSSGQKALLGFGFGAALVAGGVGTLGAAGCSSNNNNTTPPADGSTQDTSTTTDAANETGTQDAGVEAEAGPALPAPVVYLVHASPALPAVRFCLGIGIPPVTIAAFPPLPDTTVPPAPVPALVPGLGGPFVPPDNLDFSTLSLTVYAVSAAAVANNTADGGPDGGAELTCDELIPIGDAGASNPLPSSDYGQVATIPAGTLKDGNAYVLALTGCPGGLAADGGVAPLCGSGYADGGPNGNLGFTVFQLDNTTMVDGGAMGAQFAHASTAWDYLANVDNAFTGMGFFQATPPADDAGPDAGPGVADTPVAAPIVFGDISPKMLAPVSGLSFNAGTGAFAGIGTSPTSPLKALLLPFSDITQLTYGTQVPEGGAPQNGRGYVFVLVGDPSQNLGVNPLDGGAGLNLEAAHFLVFPTSKQ